MYFSLIFPRNEPFNKYGKFTKCSTLIFLKLFWRKRAQVLSFIRSLLKDHILLFFKSELRIFAYSSSICKYVAISAFSPFKSRLWLQKPMCFWWIFVIPAPGQQNILNFVQWNERASFYDIPAKSFIKRAFYHFWNEKVHFFVPIFRGSCCFYPLYASLNAQTNNVN